MEKAIELTSEFSRVAVTKYRIRDVKTNTFFNDNKQAVRNISWIYITFTAATKFTGINSTRNGQDLHKENRKTFTKKFRMKLKRRYKHSFLKRVNNVSFQLFQWIYKWTNSNLSLNEVCFFFSLGKSWQNYCKFTWKTKSVKRKMVRESKVDRLALPGIKYN